MLHKKIEKAILANRQLEGVDKIRTLFIFLFPFLLRLLLEHRAAAAAD